MGGTSRLYAGFIGEREYKNSIFICIGVGGALHNGNLKEFEYSDMENKLLGSRLLFHIPFEIGYAINTIRYGYRF